MGNPCALTRRWILVPVGRFAMQVAFRARVDPPLERPKRCLGVPLLRLPHSPLSLGPIARHGSLVGADHSAVDHLQGVWLRPALVQRFKNVFPEPSQGPSSELPVNAGPFAELFRQIPQRRTSSCNPKNPIQNKAVIGWLTAIRGAGREDKVFKQLPLLVAHKVSRRAGLHSRCQLESPQGTSVNPFCQQTLRSGPIDFPAAA